MRSRCPALLHVKLVTLARGGRHGRGGEMEKTQNLNIDHMIVL